MNPKSPSIALSVLLSLSLSHLRAEESLPPIKDNKVPQNLNELWAGFDPRKEPLNVEITKEWEHDGIICRVIRYQVGLFKGAPAKVAAFYAFPKGAHRLPGLLQMHGGGQSASLETVITEAKRGYACLSINWGGNKMNLGKAGNYEGPNTDWGNLDATHPPQRNKINHFAGSITPDLYTLDAVESPRNSNWYLVLIAARRALTFLETQPEIDPTKLGAYGHSMGGKLTTDLTGIDKRLKASVPSCGGAGTLLESQIDLPGGKKTKISALELACIADNPYIEKISIPTLWLSPTNDFNADMDNMAYTWRNVPEELLRLSITPHLNHRHTNEHAITQHLWFEQYLKGVFIFPQTPKLELQLKTTDGIPIIVVHPDSTTPIERVDIYYSNDSHDLTRFWRSAQAVHEGDKWNATIPILTLEEPVFAYANVVYQLPIQYRNIANPPGQGSTEIFVISSRELAATPKQLKLAGVKATDHPERLIDDGSRAWHDWYQLNWDHPPLWTASTRKLKDPKWRGPDGATLRFEIKSEAANTLVVKLNCNAWGAFVPGKSAIDYTAVKELKASKDWQTVSIDLRELVATDPKFTEPLANWQTVTELSLSPGGETVREGQRVKLEGKPWQGPREIRNLHWAGGEYRNVQLKSSALNEQELQKGFNEAIKNSLEQEKLDREK